MKKTKLLMVISLLGLLGGVHPAAAIGTAFTYQGRLVDAGSPATGLYDMRYTVWDSAAAGLQVGGAVVLAPVSVSGGLFTVPLDFGPGIFTGVDRYLQIESRVFGGPAYSVITPRQKLTPTPYAITAGSVAATAGAVPDAGLTANVALLNRNPQTFSGSNTFGAVGIGIAPAAKLHVNAGSGSGYHADAIIGPGGYVTGEEHSINFDDSIGHIGSLIVGYDGSRGYFSVGNLYHDGLHPTGSSAFKVFGNGNVVIDPANLNDGLLNNGNTNTSGLTFGTDSGEGLASKRTAGGNQFGLDFFTAGIPRMSLSNSGNLLFPDPLTSLIFPVTAGANNPMIYMFNSGTANSDRMVIAHSPSYPSWGLQYSDPLDKFNFLSGGTAVMTVDLGTQRIGIGTTSPGARLDVRGDVKLGSTGQYFATGGDENLRILRGIVNTTGGIYNGTGFTITHTGTGTYTITFNPPFSDAPALTITPYTAASPVTANCTSGTGSGYQVTTWVGAAKGDTWWNFTAIGAR